MTRELLKKGSRPFTAFDDLIVAPGLLEEVAQLQSGRPGADDQIVEAALHPAPFRQRTKIVGCARRSGLLRPETPKGDRSAAGSSVPDGAIGLLADNIIRRSSQIRAG